MCKECLDLRFWLVWPLGRENTNVCFLFSNAVWLAARVVCPSCVDETRPSCIYCTACSLNLSGSASPRFLLLFFVLPLQSLQAQLVWACTAFSVHVFCGFNLGSCFWRHSLLCLFVSKCSTLLESSAHHRMGKSMWWPRLIYCQMFHSLHESLWSLP